MKKSRLLVHSALPRGGCGRSGATYSAVIVSLIVLNVLISIASKESPFKNSLALLLPAAIILLGWFAVALVVLRKNSSPIRTMRKWVGTRGASAQRNSLPRTVSALVSALAHHPARSRGHGAPPTETRSSYETLPFHHRSNGLSTLWLWGGTSWNSGLSFLSLLSLPLAGLPRSPSHRWRPWSRTKSLLRRLPLLFLRPASIHHGLSFNSPHGGQDSRQHRDVVHILWRLSRS